VLADGHFEWFDFGVEVALDAEGDALVGCGGEDAA
jgi:hypothetical protein